LAVRRWIRLGLLGLPLAFVGVFLVVPLGLTVVISFWRRAGFRIQPAFSFDSYAEFFSGARLFVLERGLAVALEATIVSLAIAYPIAYFLSRHTSARAARTVLLLFTAPFLVNYIIRTFAWSYLFARTGPINTLLVAGGLTHQPLDWLLYSHFSILVGLVMSYMPFMLFPLWLTISAVDRRLVEASWLLGVPPLRTFIRVTLPLSMPGVFAAVLFGFVGAFGEGAVPTILGGVGYQLMGNTITSTLDVLNYPLAAAMSSVVVAAMFGLLFCWYLLFDLRSFLGKILRWRM
jgi:ABC-type spermidine/putrescine transport system permease subunit I